MGAKPISRFPFAGGGVGDGGVLSIVELGSVGTRFTLSFYHTLLLDYT
jgi:hypothetical protein